MIIRVKTIFVIYLLVTIIFYNKNLYASKISIVANVDGEIITNYDVTKESEYLKILNPNLEQLEKNQLFQLAKKSLINEIIKKKEIEKYLVTDNENIFTEDQLKDLYLKLNFKNIEEFEEYLNLKGDISLEEVKNKIEVELFWNELIYLRYKSQVKIDKDSIAKKIDELDNDTQNEYFLSEINFTKKKDQSIEELIKEIKLSINEIGFNNTANIYSTSSSSNLGGKLGWINEDKLSKPILRELQLINVGDYTNVLKIGNDFLILKIDQIRQNKMKINKEEKINDLIKAKTNQQLNQFSKIYFDKSIINYTIDEK
tara:strand:+ start:6061 stop:7002 length:942 start_codon:yes stop_codon:yes gene_type:complete